MTDLFQFCAELVYSLAGYVLENDENGFYAMVEHYDEQGFSFNSIRTPILAFLCFCKKSCEMVLTHPDFNPHAREFEERPIIKALLYWSLGCKDVEFTAFCVARLGYSIAAFYRCPALEKYDRDFVHDVAEYLFRFYPDDNQIGDVNDALAEYLARYDQFAVRKIAAAWKRAVVANRSRIPRLKVPKAPKAPKVSRSRVPHQM